MNRRAIRVANRTRSRRRQGGATIVESALVLPLVMLVILGILEGALMYRSYLSANNAANGGARAGSVEGQDSTSDYSVLQAILRDASGASSDQISEVIIYNASVPGAGPSQQCIDNADAKQDVGVAGQCDVYVNADLSRPESDFSSSDFQADQFWLPSERSISLADPTYLGVWIDMECQCMTSILGIAPDLHATAVVQVEPDSA